MRPETAAPDAIAAASTADVPASKADARTGNAGPAPAVSIVVPVFNESAGLARFDARLAAVCDGLDRSVEVIYVDDGSRDRSLDVLTGMGPLRVCTAYRGAEEARFDAYPYHQTVLHQAVGEYEELPGWDEDLSDARDETDLPQAARDYLAFVADFVGVPIALIGVGPGRDQVIWTEAGRASLAAGGTAAAA